jgi:conjugal transfer pilus assembly protein TraK
MTISTVGWASVCCLLLSVPSLATTIKEVRDGSTVLAQIAAREPTRIKVEGGRITAMRGDVYTEKNPAGLLETDVDNTSGDWFIQPMRASDKPINLFVTTTAGTYTLLLQPADIPADTLLLRDRSAKAVQYQARNLAYVRDLKTMMRQMLETDPDATLQIAELNQPVLLWQEARFTLTRRYDGHPRWLGERFALVNISAQPMTLSEREFFREGVAAVVIDNPMLAPGEATTVYVIRDQEPV